MKRKTKLKARLPKKAEPMHDLFCHISGLHAGLMETGAPANSAIGKICFHLWKAAAIALDCHTGEYFKDSRKYMANAESYDQPQPEIRSNEKSN